MFQSAMNALNPVLRVQDQILDAITAHLKLPRHEAREKAATLLDLVGIPRDRLRAYPHELSGGMRQRVMIAMALAADPEVVIMDEPTTALDVVVQRDILAQIVELKETLGFAVLFITHDLSLLLELADRIAVMYAGRLLETGTASAIMREPAHPYTRGLLQLVPVAARAAPGAGRHPRHAARPARRAARLPVHPALLVHHPSLRGGRHVARPSGRRPRRGTGPSRADHHRQPPHRLSHRDPRRSESGRGAVMTEPIANVPAAAGGLAPVEPAVTGQSAAPAVNAAADQVGEPAVVESVAASRGPLAMEAVGLNKVFKLGRGAMLQAVRNVSFNLYQGAVVALVGESGSGKSTVAKLLAGQERPTSGQVIVDGKPIDVRNTRSFRAYKSHVQYVFQDPFSSLNPVHTVGYDLTRPVRLHQPGVKDVPAAVTALLEQVRLTPAEQFVVKYPHELSGGQRQRVSFARALAAQPTVLLADEPVSMLDVSIRLEMLNLLDDLRTRLSLALLYITHDIASARYFADEVLVMYGGQIVERGPAEDVTQHPAHPYTQLLIASAPDPDNLGSSLRAGNVVVGPGGAIAGKAGNVGPAQVGCPFSNRCPIADDKCRRENPALQLLTPVRAAACWRLDVAASPVASGSI